MRRSTRSGIRPERGTPWWPLALGATSKGVRVPCAPRAYHDLMAEDEQDQAEQPDFEEVVAALLKVDPEGIIGAEGKVAREKKRAKDADS